MMSIFKSLLSDFKNTYKKYVKYIEMQIIKDNEIPTKWKNRIWNCLIASV
ncbi:hypothetical protein C1645_816594 [Glomus cerebriforme]|uniref:Uncharacterized protein n=1 Tax=Glomus cerebriforme TaxID=658196 RepID=A0A397TB64_9GLOM|nr:hypothetical protein C1645_816594 [Glomus cerebriforme]